MSPNGTHSAYVQVAEHLRCRILSQELEPGSRITPERELCEQFGTSRITIRQALQILEDEQLIIRHQGRGTFVSPRPSRKIPIRHTDYVSSIATHAPETQRQIDDWGWQKAIGDIASSLNVLPRTRVMYARRLDQIDAQTVNYDEVYILEHFAVGLTEDDLSKIDFISAWLQKHPIKIKCSTQRIEAVAADRIQAKCLDVRVGSPLLKNIDIVRISTNEPVAMFISLYRHDLFHMTATVNAQQTE